jgi:dephospho-CoA kinase
MIIGLCGAEGAGKSSVARRLAAVHAAEIIPFAKPLKDMLIALGVPPESLYGTPEQKEEPLDILCGKSGRYAAQRLGTEFGRNLIGPDIWVNAWTERVISSRAPTIVADDLRFHNEAETVRVLGGFVICVRNTRAAVVDRNKAHPSQRWWDIRSDFTIDNDGDLNDLYRQVDRVVQSMTTTQVAV